MKRPTQDSCQVTAVAVSLLATSADSGCRVDGERGRREELEAASGEPPVQVTVGRQSETSGKGDSVSCALFILDRLSHGLHACLTRGYSLAAGWSSE